MNPPKPRAFWRALIISSAVFIVLLLNSYLQLGYRLPQVSQLADEIKVKLPPATLLVETRNKVRLKAVADFNPSCGRINAAVTNQHWQQSFSRTELLNGVEPELRLMSAFLVAGAKTVVASRWEVGARPEIDQEVADFYGEQIHSDQEVETALRRVRARLRTQSGIGHHSYARGAFSLYR